MDRCPRLIARLVLALTIGATIAGLCLNTIWQGGRNRAYLPREQHETQRILKTVEYAVAQHYQAKPGLPESLKQLRPEPSLHLNKDSKGRILDGWGHSLTYSRQGDRFLVGSLGRDGRPGGKGADADLTNTRTHAPEAAVPLEQFLRHNLTPGMVGACLVSGALAFLLTLVATVSEDFRSANTGFALILKVAATFIGAAIAATFMAALHIPTGH